MLASDRQNKIKELVLSHYSLKISELSEISKVSEMTIQGKMKNSKGCCHHE
ncbi:DeoR family transcriptional regulator [Robertmurraya kyonggiensis]|uniref:DeoR family transcriptional regulator n=1 Tax=Robertmurraya kyonggiensis TaxID=1037680 RepID=A0A4U1D8T4_9BACI|nr:DeoR family transcriptional regulator [Robertmurraya kyonggiensis]TKC18844.1 DeoR family transcriptional regulator [Robertmurraya kyonggiensis]